MNVFLLFWCFVIINILNLKKFLLIFKTNLTIFYFGHHNRSNINNILNFNPNLIHKMLFIICSLAFFYLTCFHLILFKFHQILFLNSNFKLLIPLIFCYIFKFLIKLCVNSTKIYNNTFFFSFESFFHFTPSFLEISINESSGCFSYSFGLVSFI